MALDDAEVYGVVLDIDESQPTDYEVWPENWPAVDLFMRCITQWRHGPTGVPLGLDYAAVVAVGSMVPTAAPLRRMEDLQVIEMRALEIFREQARKAQDRARREGR